MANKMNAFGNKPKAVIQIKDGKEIKQFKSIADATKEIKKNNPNALCTHISECANGKIKSAYGYVWKFAK